MNCQSCNDSSPGSAIYYSKSVRNDNIQGASYEAIGAAIALERRLDAAKAPIIAVASYIELVRKHMMT